MTASRAETDRAGRSARLIALALGIPILLLIVALMAMPFMAREETPLQAVGPVPAAPGAEQGGVRFTGTVHVWDVSGSIAIDAERNARLSFHLRGPDSHPPSMMMDIPIVFDMAEHDMEPLRLQAEQVGLGAFAAEAPLSMAGSWLMRMEFSEVAGVLRFEVDE